MRPTVMCNGNLGITDDSIWDARTFNPLVPGVF